MKEQCGGAPSGERGTVGDAIRNRSKRSVVMGDAKKQRSYYCKFCREDVEPSVIHATNRHGMKWSARQWMYLCPRCGGNVVKYAKHRGYIPEIDGLAQIGRKK